MSKPIRVFEAGSMKAKLFLTHCRTGVDYEIDVDIDVDSLAHMIARTCVYNRTKRTTQCGGFAKAKAKALRKTDPHSRRRVPVVKV